MLAFSRHAAANRRVLTPTLATCASRGTPRCCTRPSPLRRRDAFGQLSQRTRNHHASSVRTLFADELGNLLIAAPEFQPGDHRLSLDDVECRQSALVLVECLAPQ